MSETSEVVLSYTSDVTSTGVWFFQNHSFMYVQATKIVLSVRLYMLFVKHNNSSPVAQNKS